MLDPQGGGAKSIGDPFRVRLELIAPSRVIIEDLDVSLFNPADQFHISEPIQVSTRAWR